MDRTGEGKRRAEQGITGEPRTGQLLCSYCSAAGTGSRRGAGKNSNSGSGKDARSIGCAETAAGAHTNGRERPYNVTTLPGYTDEEGSRLPFLSGGRRRREREQLPTRD